MRMRREVHTGFWWENLKEMDHLQDLDTDGRIIWMDLKELGMSSSGSGLEPVVVSYDRSNKTSVSTGDGDLPSWENTSISRRTPLHEITYGTGTSHTHTHTHTHTRTLIPWVHQKLSFYHTPLQSWNAKEDAGYVTKPYSGEWYNTLVACSFLTILICVFSILSW